MVEGEEVDERIEMGDVAGVLWARYHWITRLWVNGESIEVGRNEK